MKNSRQLIWEFIKKQTLAKLKSPGFEDHRWPITRREFIQLGILQGAGMVMMPSAVSLFSQKLNAQESNHIPFLVLDLAGGAAMPGNFLATDEGQQLLKDYSTHGWNPKESGALNESFGIPMSAKYSQILRGLLETTTPNVRANFKMASIMTQTEDDTSSNQISALGLIARTQSGGIYFKSGLGARSSESGGNSRTSYLLSEHKPIYVNSADSLTNAAGLDNLPMSEDKNALSQYLNSVKNSDLAFLRKNYPSSDRLHKVASLNLENLNDVVAGTKFNPGNDQATSRIFGLGGENGVQASIVYNLLQRHVGPSSITIEKCDYHDRTSATGDAKDLTIGQLIGRIISLAAAKKTPLMIQIVTDGGVYGRGGSRNWLGDSRVHSMSVLGFFNPNQPPELFNGRFQVGSYTSDGIINQDTIVGKNNDMALKVVLANYLHVSGRLGEFSNIIGNSAFSAKQLEEFLLFA